MGANDIQHGGSHYKGAKLQHWDIVARNGIGYLEGCSSKYFSRWRNKNGLEDLLKGLHYIDKILEMVSDWHYRPSGVVPSHELVEFFEQNSITDVNEITVIQTLLQWEDVEDLHVARRFAEDIIREAQAA